MKTYIQRGKVLQLTAPYQVTSGQGALVGTVFGVAATDVANGVVGEFMLVGVHNLAKHTGEAWTQGATIYWDNTNKYCTTTSTSNTKIGVATQAQLSADATGYVRLNGSF